MKVFTIFAAVLVGLTLSAMGHGQPTEREHFIGREVESFRLASPTLTTTWDLSKATQNASATVIYFLGTECPVNNLYVPIINEIGPCFLTP